MARALQGQSVKTFTLRHADRKNVGREVMPGDEAGTTSISEKRVRIYGKGDKLEDDTEGLSISFAKTATQHLCVQVATAVSSDDVGG